ncbi:MULTISPECIES: SDR family oxidoreductase [Comamonas]|uniref:Peroxisomal trans-2-enoyl-CoA reductase n=1 Tax=Comamonas thiooxydans TaxID=363952 RepID=A0AA42Q0L4_9BURK|nr:MULTISPECIES: SDR family oxidoreductase [Comamonas]BCX53611.1 short-chain dehydrogenase [Comamonas testosteroni]KKI15265.1 2,4-dienoyl-CoA reductase [Comamonas thiooxydans]MDH1334034.1 SDR family oxidoreductase [Comamonas thiooxydans]MDH1740044.1 SDR family oxidoreductase [Comamonas thiooxydans]MDH1786376.1 SDR family oxidoreductase [Comamonas thiooxydans]
MYRSVFRAALFAGQVVVVTGSGSGIGRCVAHELASLGATVALVGRNQDKLAAVQAELQQAGVSEDRVSRHRADIRDEAAVKALVTEVLARHGRIDALVNNAGGQYIAPLASIGAKGWQAVLDTNLTGGFLMARECFVQHMAEHGGSIVNMVADMWGSMPGMGHSGAARAGMVSLTETAAAEWAPHGVRVNAIAPGYIASSGMDHYPPEAAAMLRKMPATVPAGRFGNEAEVSASIVFLLSPAASFISGTVLRVDGARPQVRMGMGPVAASAEVQQRGAVRAFDGFSLYQTPKVFQS